MLEVLQNSTTTATAMPRPRLGPRSLGQVEELVGDHVAG
jgi:hypothetical protein